MILWIDAQLSPALARWISETFGVAAHAVRDLGLREAKDFVIFHAAREAGAVVRVKTVILSCSWSGLGHLRRFCG